MHTIGEAAQLLGIGRVTLEKWCKRLHITPERHPQDWRYRVLTDEQVQAIRDERAKMPSFTPTYTRNALRAKSDDSVVSEPRPMVAPMPRQRPLQRATFSALPDGMMSKEDASRLHNVPTTTLRRWCAEGRIETTSGQYPGEGGRYGVVDPLTRRGLAQLYQLASHRADFTRCPGCPHDEASQQIAE